MSNTQNQDELIEDMVARHARTVDSWLKKGRTIGAAYSEANREAISAIQRLYKPIGEPNQNLVVQLLDIIDAGDSKRYEAAKRIAGFIESNYKPIGEIESVINSVEHSHDNNGHTGRVRRRMADEIKNKLGLGGKSDG